MSSSDQSTGLLSLFSFLSEEQGDAFQRCFIQRSYLKGQFFLRAGEVANEVAYIESGAFRFFVSSETHETTVDLCASGDFLGDYLSLLSRTPASIFIEATKSSVIRVASASALDSLFSSDPQFERVGRLVAQNVAMGLGWRLRQLLNENPAERYQQLLAAKPHIFNEFPQYMIASYLGITAETLSRLRSKLKHSRVS